MFSTYLSPATRPRALVKFSPPQHFFSKPSSHGSIANLGFKKTCYFYRLRLCVYVRPWWMKETKGCFNTFYVTRTIYRIWEEKEREALPGLSSPPFPFSLLLLSIHYVLWVTILASKGFGAHPSFVFFWQSTLPPLPRFSFPPIFSLLTTYSTHINIFEKWPSW